MANLIKKHIENKPEWQFVSERAAYCNACSKEIRIGFKSVKSCIKGHENSNHHQANMRLWGSNRTRQTFLHDLTAPVSSDFFIGIAQFFVSCNIPFYKANMSGFQEFCRNWCNKSPPDESTLRKHYLSKLYAKSLSTIRKDIGDNWIYLQVDETCDFQQRPVVSVLVGALNGLHSDPYLLNLSRISSGSANSSTLIQAITDSLAILWPDGIRYDKVRLLVTDQANYMLTVGRLMRETLYPNMMHVTCLAHALHRVCEKVRSDYQDVDSMVSSLKRLLARCPRRRRELNEVLGEPLGSLPIETRWGTWIKFCSSLIGKLTPLRLYVESIEEDSAAIEPLKTGLSNIFVTDNLSRISDFSFVCDSIKDLEVRGLDVQEQRSIVDRVLNRLTGSYKTKLQGLLARNPSYGQIFDISDPDVRHKLRFAPLVTVDVERSFSVMNLVDTEMRQSFNEENFCMYAMLYYNARRDPSS